MAALLSVENLVKHFTVVGSKDLVNAVNGVSVEIAQGDTLGLVGETGSGKTTVGRCVLRLIEPTSGRVRFRGQDVTEVSRGDFRRRFRPSMQMVFQEPYDSLNPRMTIGTIVEEPLVLQGKLGAKERRERVIELMSTMHLEERLLRRYPHQLSGGQQQRVGIARAMATNPDLVVLDEPTSALDISIRADILDLLISVRRATGTAYLFISHDLTAVQHVCDRVAVMYLGKIVELASTEIIFERQWHPYGKALLSSVLYPDPDQPVTQFQMSGEIPSPIDLPSGCYLHARCPLAQSYCSEQNPELVEVAKDHYVACFRWEELARLSEPADLEEKTV